MPSKIINKLKNENNKGIKKIVVIDDDQEFLDEIKEMLILTGYDVIAFPGGTNSVEEIKKVIPDIILLDLKMKGKNGFQIAEELRSTPETLNIPVIAMTGYFTKEEHRFLMRVCGIKEVLLKPINPLDVIHKIEWLEANSQGNIVNKLQS